MLHWGYMKYIGFIWLYKVKKELNDKGAKIPSLLMHYFLMPFLIGLAVSFCIYLCFVKISLYNSSFSYVVKYGTEHIRISYVNIYYLIQAIFIAPVAYLNYKFSEAFDNHATKDKNSLSYFILLTLPIINLISPIILQHKINQSLES